MTERGRYGGTQRQAQPGTVRLRVVGTSEEVARAVLRIASVTTVLDQSPQQPRRGERGQVAVYVQARLDGQDPRPPDLLETRELWDDIQASSDRLRAERDRQP